MRVSTHIRGAPEDTGRTHSALVTGKGRPIVLPRMMDVLQLDSNVYRDVRDDPRSTLQAVIIVMLTAGVSALTGLSSTGITGLMSGLLLGVLGWILFAALTHTFGRWIYRGNRAAASWGQLLRTLGFAQTPQVLLLLAIIPFIGWLMTIFVFLWFVVTTIQAIRVAFGFERIVPAIVTGGVAWFFFVIPYWWITAFLLW